MKTLKFIIGAFITILFMSSCQNKTTNQNGISSQVEEKSMDIEFGDEFRYDQVHFLENGSVDLEKTLGVPNIIINEEKAAASEVAPSWIYFNLGYFGEGYTLSQASFLASYIATTNAIHDEYGCDLLISQGVFQQPFDDSKFYVRYKSTSSPESDYENFTAQIHLNPSCSCGQGGIKTLKLIDDHYIFQQGNDCFINTFPVFQVTTLYCE